LAVLTDLGRVGILVVEAVTSVAARRDPVCGSGVPIVTILVVCHESGRRFAFGQAEGLAPEAVCVCLPDLGAAILLGVDTVLIEVLEPIPHLNVVRRCRQTPS
jgi:hypothetical protein